MGRASAPRQAPPALQCPRGHKTRPRHGTAPLSQPHAPGWPGQVVALLPPCSSTGRMATDHPAWPQRCWRAMSASAGRSGTLTPSQGTATPNTACRGLPQGTMWVPMGAGLPRELSVQGTGHMPRLAGTPLGRGLGQLEGSGANRASGFSWLCAWALGLPHALVPTVLPSPGSREPQNRHEQLPVRYGWILTPPCSPHSGLGTARTPKASGLKSAPWGQCRAGKRGQPQLRGVPQCCREPAGTHILR